MKKRIMALVLGAAMALSLAAPAFAAETPTPYDVMPVSADIEVGETAAEANSEALARVTLAVKGALDIDDSYTSFSGSSSKTGALNYWSLNWSSEDGSINVRANDAGKVLSYSYYDSDSDVAVEWSWRLSARIPQNSREDALEAAKAFVAPLLDENESIEWQSAGRVRELSVNTYFIAGTLMINGVKSPISINLNVRASDLTVTRFNRGDGYTMLLPEVPSADAPADIDEAAEQLRGAYTLELQYVLDDDGQPVLRYVLTDSKELLVDAKTGELIDVDALRAAVRNAGAGEYETGVAVAEDAVDNKYMMSSAAAPTLSPVEQQAIAKLEGAKSIEELETIARAMDALGLTAKFSLVSSSYSQVSYVDPDARGDDEEDVTDVYANLRFVRERRDEEGKLIRTSKTVRLDAKTGEFTSVSGYSNEPVTMDGKVLAANAEAFAKEHAEHFDSYKLYDTQSKWSDGTYFTYYRTENGVPFKNDSITVSVNGSDGSIVSFSYNYTDDLTFPTTDGIVDMEAAIDAYFGAYTVELGYAELPTAVTPEDPRPLCAEFADAGYSYIYELRLVYGAELKDGWLRGIDAKTGKAVIKSSTPRTGITYSDVDLSYAADIAKELGEYGVGYTGGKLNPTAALTQLDMLFLLLSADGYEIPAEPTEDDINYFYTRAEWFGVTFAEKNPTATVSRIEFVRTLVGMTTYGGAAKLEGIWSPGFADDAAIAASDMGYLAIAKALGIVNGDTDGSFHPADAMSRQDALIALYNYMTK